MTTTDDKEPDINPLYEMSQDQIADELGITRGRVGQLLRQAISKIKTNHPEFEEWLNEDH